jgi:hypothetical protein
MSSDDESNLPQESTPSPLEKPILVKPNNGFLRNSEDYLKIPEFPTYNPSKEEFADPIILISKLRSLGYEKYGCVKIVPPEGWKP